MDVLTLYQTLSPAGEMQKQGQRRILRPMPNMRGAGSLPRVA